MFESGTEPIGQRLERLRPIYISVFLTQIVVMGALITWRELTIGGHATGYDVFITVILKMDDVCYLAIATSILIVDFGRYLVGLLIKAPQDRAYERGLGQGISQGIAQGVAEERQRWLDYDTSIRDYNRRFKDALDKGEPFDEPPPEPPSTV